MAENKPIELRYYRLAPDDATVFLRIWKLTDPATGQPVERTAVSAGFHVNLGRRQYLTLTLDDGLTWDDTTKSLNIRITNQQTAFIREDGELQYEAFVVWNDGETQPLREGTVTAVRVG